MPDVARVRRQHESARYRPATVRLLLIAEAPPCTLDRYFYFDDVRAHDWLFRYVYGGLFGEKADLSRKPEHLARIKSAGVYLIDTCEQPIADGAKTRITPADVESVVERAVALRPDAVIVIKSNVYDETYEPLVAAGLRVANVKMPFPASGQQKKFETAFARALNEVGFDPHKTQPQPA